MSIVFRGKKYYFHETTCLPVGELARERGDLIESWSGQSERERRKAGVFFLLSISEIININVCIGAILR